MDVRFCEGRNPCREAHVRTVSSKDTGVRALRARQEKCAFHLTKTYMDVGYSEVIRLVPVCPLLAPRLAG